MESHVDIETVHTTNKITSDFSRSCKSVLWHISLYLL